MAGSQLAAAYVELSAQTGKFDSAMNAAVSKTEKSTKSMQSHLDKLGKSGFASLASNLQSSLSNMSANWAAMLLQMGANIVKFVAMAGAALAGLAVAFAAFAVKAASSQADADAALAASLKRVGAYSEETMKRLTNLASAFQRVTIYEDDTIEAGMALALNMGVQADQLDATAKAAIGLSARFGIDLETAFRLLGKAAAGNFAVLGRYGIIVDQNATAAEKFQQVLAQGAAGFELAIAQANTFSGQLKVLKNTFGEFLEGVGKPILDWMKTRLLGATGNLGEWLDANQAKLAAWATKIGEVFQKLLDGASAFFAGLLGISGDSMGQSGGFVDMFVAKLNELGAWWATNGFQMGEAAKQIFVRLGMALIFVGKIVIALGLTWITLNRPIMYMFVLMTQGINAAKKFWGESVAGAENMKRTLYTLMDAYDKLGAIASAPGRAAPRFTPITPGAYSSGTAPGAGAPGVAPEEAADPTAMNAANRELRKTVREREGILKDLPAATIAATNAERAAGAAWYNAQQKVFAGGGEDAKAAAEALAVLKDAQSKRIGIINDGLSAQEAVYMKELDAQRAVRDAKLKLEMGDQELTKAQEDTLDKAYESEAKRIKDAFQAKRDQLAAQNKIITDAEKAITDAVAKEEKKRAAQSDEIKMRSAAYGKSLQDRLAGQQAQVQTATAELERRKSMVQFTSLSDLGKSLAVKGAQMGLTPQQEGLIYQKTSAASLQGILQASKKQVDYLEVMMRNFTLNAGYEA